MKPKEFGMHIKPDLLPCPFCGGQARLIGPWGQKWVQCSHCLINTDVGEEDKVIGQWNARVKA